MLLSSVGVERERSGDLSRPAGPQSHDQPAAPHAGATSAQYLAGKTALENGNPAQAADAFRCALELDPRFASAHYGLGRALIALGSGRSALDSMLRATELQHDHVPALFYAGELHAELGQREDAQDCFSLALSFDPLSSAARIALARLLAASEGNDAAIALLREAVDTGIADADVYCSLADWLDQSGSTQEAIAIYRTAIDTFPEHLPSLVKLGLLHLARLGEARQAEVLFRCAAEMAPSMIEAQANLGLALQEQGRFDEALRHYAAQIAAHPEVVEFRWNRGLANLSQGNFEVGWDDYEDRKHRVGGEIHGNYTFPDWSDSPLTGRTILVYGEQGLGDEIMFACCLPQVIAQAEATIVECDARLVELLRRSFPAARIEGRVPGRDCRAAYPEVDVQSAIGSLPRFLRRRHDDFPKHRGYLVADEKKIAKWRSYLANLAEGRKIGISWRGGTFKTRGKLRSLPIEAVSALFDYEDALFVDLQARKLDHERDWLDEHFPGRLVRLEDALATVDELAALICGLDLIISVPNTNVHLGGAFGIPTWVLLTASPEWRYLWQGTNMPWYPTARLFRQTVPGEWAPVISQVAAELKGMAKS